MVQKAIHTFVLKVLPFQTEHGFGLAILWLDLKEK